MKSVSMVLRFLAFVVVLFSSRAAVACQCSRENDVDALARAAFVVVGTVTGEFPADSRSQTVVAWKDVRALRGEAVGSTLSLGNGDDCQGQSLEVGKRYVVYLASKDATMTVCQRVIEVSKATEAERKAFPSLLDTASTAPPGAGAAPSPPSAAPSPPASSGVVPGHGGCASCNAGARDTEGGLSMTILAFSLAIVRFAATRRTRE